MNDDACLHHIDLVGISEIAGRLNVRRSTVDNWRHTGQLPDPRWTVSGRPVWEWTLDIEPWARRTGKTVIFGNTVRKPRPGEPEIGISTNEGKIK